MSRRVVGTVIAIASAAIALTACSGSTGTHTQSGPPSNSSASTSASQPPPSSSAAPSSSVTTAAPQGGAALAAYTAFQTASRNAEKRPSDLSLRKVIAAHSIEPALTNEAAGLLSYSVNDIAWLGTPPSPRAKILALQLGATPYPTVTLKDCPTAAPSWKPYNIKTHQPVPVKFPGSTAPPPHAITATVVYYHSQWVVQKTVTEVKKTCAPS